MLPKIKPSKKLIYLDHAAATPLDVRVKRAMEPFLSKHFGNPSSLYKEGVLAKQALDQSRKTIAEIIHARPQEIIFTAGGSGSINLAILGIARCYRLTHPKGGHIISSVIEHHAVLHCLQALEKEGFRTTLIKVNKEGLVNLDELKKAIRKDTILISIMYANNEIGTIQAIIEIGRWLRGLNESRIKNQESRIWFHSDACQAAGSLELDVNKLGVDLLSVNGAKIYGPKQTGFLFVRDGVVLYPLIFGGGQERGLRSGTENVAGVAGLAEALQLCQQNTTKENKRLIQLRDYFIKRLLNTIPEVSINGTWKKGTQNRLPNNIHVTFQSIDGEALVLYLDAYNIAAATGSACTQQDMSPSHVLLAIGQSKIGAKSSVRFTLGKSSTKQDIDYVMKVLPKIVQQLREVSSFDG